MIILDKKLKEKYDSQYSDNTEEWRRIGAIGKVQNIIDLTEGLMLDTIVDIGAGEAMYYLYWLKKNLVQN